MSLYDVHATREFPREAARTLASADETTPTAPALHAPLASAHRCLHACIRARRRRHTNCFRVAHRGTPRVSQALTSDAPCAFARHRTRLRLARVAASAVALASTLLAAAAHASTAPPATARRASSCARGSRRVVANLGVSPRDAPAWSKPKPGASPRHVELAQARLPIILPSMHDTESNAPRPVGLLHRGERPRGMRVDCERRAARDGRRLPHGESSTRARVRAIGEERERERG